MSQFFQIAGAKRQETFWFASIYNALSGKTGHIRQTLKSLQSAASKLLKGQQARSSSFFLHIFAILTPFSTLFMSW